MTEPSQKNKENAFMAFKSAAFAAALPLLSATAVFLAASGAPRANAQALPPGISRLTQNAFQKPNPRPPSGSTTFTPASSDNLFVAQLLAKLKGNTAQKQAMQTYATQINQVVEKAYTDYGFQKNDVGVALGAFLETGWDISHDTFKTGEATTSEKTKTRAAMRQMQNALLTAPNYKTLSAKDKQLLYEACTFMSGHLVMQRQQAGSDGAKRASVQQTARQQLQSLFGVGADSLERRPDGTFASSTFASSTPKRGGTTMTSSPAASASNGPFPAASAHGAQVFIKYVFDGMETHFDPLILFPDGAAFTDTPAEAVSSFSEATLRASGKPYDVGTWKRASGSTIVLNFPNRTRDKITTLRKVAKGWYDSTGKLETDNSYDTYFPIIFLSPAQLAGAWESQSLSTMGLAGGAAPMVASGSSKNRVFNANGTFAGGSKSFASATTANMGDGFKSGSGDVGVYNEGSKKGAGRWRLDGPLLTMETDNKRTVTLAFVLPHWNNGPPEILINGERWERPGKK